MGAISIGQLTQAIQLVQLAVAVTRSLVAAFKAANPGVEMPDDAVLIRILSDNSAAGQAEAEALIERLRAAQG